MLVSSWVYPFMCVEISLCVHSSMATCINVRMCVSLWMGGASADSVHGASGR